MLKLLLLTQYFVLDLNILEHLMSINQQTNDPQDGRLRFEASILLGHCFIYEDYFFERLWEDVLACFRGLTLETITFFSVYV